MNKKELEAFAREAAKSIKTEQDLGDFSRMLKKITVETALNAELDDHLGYDRHQLSDNSNSRNGYSSKSRSPKMASSRSLFRGIVRVPLNRRWLKNIRPG